MKNLRSPSFERGSATIELALSLPLLLLILWGIVTFGSLLHARMVVTRAAEDAARSISFLSGATRVEDIDSSLLLPCTTATQTAVACEVISSLERSLLVLEMESPTSRFDAIKNVTAIEVNPAICGAAGNELGIRVAVPFEALRILPAISLLGFDFTEWMPSELSACAVTAL